MHELILWRGVQLYSCVQVYMRAFNGSGSELGWSRMELQWKEVTLISHHKRHTKLVAK